MTSLVSVVIPARNEAAYIEAALMSVVDQRYPPECLECIVVDNGSTDETARVVAAFTQSHPTHHIALETEQTPGAGRAKNRGALAAHGEVVIFLDADSRLEPDLAREVATCWEAGHLAGSIRITADSNHLVDRGYFALMEIGKVLFGIRGQMMYCDRGWFLSLGGFDPNLQLAEDLEFLGRVRAATRTGSGSITHLRRSAIRTSPRRLHTLPFHLAMFSMFARWLLAFWGVGRTRKY